MKSIIFAAICVFALAGLAAAQNKSVYTSLKTENCKSIKQSDPDSYVGQCIGVGGYKLQLLEGDIRQTINVITPARKKFELNFWHYYGGFSTVGAKAEWRMKGAVPVALIVRFNVADIEDSTKNTSYLMISKIAKASSCVTDIVQPGANQNETARTLADAASTKPCKSTDAQ